MIMIGEWLYLTVLLTVVTISPVVTDDPASRAAPIISAADAAVTDGSSLAGTTMRALMNTGYSVACGIEVENWTRFPLIYPYVKLGGGVVSLPPQTILPSTREAMITHKFAVYATGTYGTVSWQIQNRRVVIMWSAPFNFDFYSNWMGVGITLPNVTTHDDGWFDLMYYSGERCNTQMCFERKEYYRSVETVLYKDSDFEIRGSMGTGHQATAKVVVIPNNEDDLATPVKTNLQRLRQKRALPENSPLAETLALLSA